VQKIPYGTTATYAALANEIGRPKAIRAVANAVGANPLAIIIPCHRIIGSDGTLRGYAGGVELKQKLLDIES
jgi:O-6-methylguanine DNA methyltransferase